MLTLLLFHCASVELLTRELKTWIIQKADAQAAYRALHWSVLSCAVQRGPTTKSFFPPPGYRLRHNTDFFFFFFLIPIKFMHSVKKRRRKERKKERSRSRRTKRSTLLLERVKFWQALKTENFAFVSIQESRGCVIGNVHTSWIWQRALREENKVFLFFLF